jgi:hypothetical protein
MPKINVKQVLTNHYEKWTLSERGKNEPNRTQTNPNKPNSNPKQTQFPYGQQNEHNLLSHNAL